MSKFEKMEDGQFIFGSIFVVANRMDTLLERELSNYDITTKQWLLSIVIDSLFDEPPTIKEVAKEMGSSHQNVKQVALKLEHKGLIKLEKDKKDARATRIRLTDESYAFWKKTEGKGISFMEAVFKDIEKDELSKARAVLVRMLSNLMEMEETERDG